MRQILTVFSYTFKEGIRKKAFLISTGIIMAIILLLCFVPRVLSLVGKDEKVNVQDTEQQDTVMTESEEKTGTCYFIDEQGIFVKNIQYFQQMYPNLNFEIYDTKDFESLKEKVAENDKNSMIYIQHQGERPLIRVVKPNFMKGISSEQVAEVCNAVWQLEYLTSRGVSEDVAAESQMPLSCEEEAAGEMDLTGYILGLVMTFVMFFAVYYYGYGVAMSVASEKTSRVMETLIISAKPSRILVGKCLAMGVLGILQLGGLLLFGVLCYSFLIPQGLQIAGLNLTFSGVSPGNILILALYFVLGYALYAVINSVCGAAVSKVEDLNSAMMPVSIIAILGFYLGYFTSVAGGGSNMLSKLAVYLPISAPFAVPFKVLTGDIGSMELLISIGLLVVTIVVVAAVSSRIYSASVMHYGNRLKWKDLRKIKTN